MNDDLDEDYDLAWMEYAMNDAPEGYVIMEEGAPTLVHGATVLDMSLLHDDPEVTDSALVERLYDRLRALQAAGEPVYQYVRETRSWLDAHNLAFAPEAMDETGEDG